MAGPLPRAASVRESPATSCVAPRPSSQVGGCHRQPLGVKKKGRSRIDPRNDRSAMRTIRIVQNAWVFVAARITGGGLFAAEGAVHAREAGRLQVFLGGTSGSLSGVRRREKALGPSTDEDPESQPGSSSSSGGDPRPKSREYPDKGRPGSKFANLAMRIFPETAASRLSRKRAQRVFSTNLRTDPLQNARLPMIIKRKTLGAWHQRCQRPATVSPGWRSAFRCIYRNLEGRSPRSR